MGNPLIEGVVDIAGRGFLAKENGNFQPGEYKRLSNLEIDRSGFLINRRNVYSPYGQNSGQVVTPITNAQRFLGNMGEYTLFTNGSKQWMVGANTFTEIWNTLTSPGAGSSFARMVGFFRYNNRNHWLVLEFNQGVSIGLSLYRDAAVPVPDVPDTYAPGYQASLTRTVILTFAAGTTDFYDFQFKNFFMYKDRLWIATSVGLYFSKATDPSDFTVPNGGFFKHPGNVVNWAFGIKDTIYTLCEDAVYALTYNTDPNVDSTERPLSDTIGGEMGCIHLDTPYFINNLGIFTINGNNVDKVMDSRFDYGKDTYANRIWSFENYLVVNKYLPINYDNNYSPPARGGLRTQLWTNPESDSVGGAQILTGWTQQNSGTKTRRNEILNPTMGATIATTWFTNNFDTNIARSTNAAHSGTHSLALTRNGTTTVDLSCNNFFLAATALLPYTFSAYVNVTGTHDVKLQIQWKDAGNAVIATHGNTTSCSGAWNRVSLTRTAPAGTVTCTLIITIVGIGSNAEQYIDDVLFEQTDQLRSYFDGSFADTTFDDYGWTGTPHASASTKIISTVIPVAATTIADGQPGKVLKFSGQVNDFDDFEGTLTSVVDVWSQYQYTLDPVAAIAALSPYTFRFDYRLVTPAAAVDYADFTLTVEYLDAANVVLGTLFTHIDSTLDQSGAYQSGLVELVPPANTDKFRFKFNLYFKTSASIQSYDLRFNRFHVERSSTYSGYFNGDSTDTVSITYNWTGVAFASTSTASPDTHGYLKNNGASFPPFLNGNSLGYNTYFINTENGATHVLDFMDQYTSVSDGGAGFIVDAITNPYKDSSGNYKWVFLTNKFISEAAGGLTYSAQPYYISSSEDTDVNDFVVDSGNALKRRAPKIDVEIDSFVPDGLEYKIKKFRSLLLQGIVPPVGLQLDVAYDNSGYVQSTALGDNEGNLTSPRRHYAHRIGLNQRGHSITLRLYNPDWISALSAPYGDTEISDLRALWSYSGRLPVTKAIGS